MVTFTLFRFDLEKLLHPITSPASIGTMFWNIKPMIIKADKIRLVLKDMPNYCFDVMIVVTTMMEIAFDYIFH